MNRMRTVLLALFLLAGVVCGCKKYPEDNAFIHFRRVKKRLTEKCEWRIIKYEVNGADSIPHVNAVINKPGNPFTVNDIKMWWKEDLGFNVHSGGRIDVEFSKGKRKAFCYFNPPSYGLTYPVMADGLNYSSRNEWTIKRMDRKAFTIELFKNNKLYRISFEAKE